MKHTLEIGDSLNGQSVTKTTDKSCWLGENRYSWETVQRMIQGGGKLQTKHNANKIIDWTKKEEVLAFYNSFVAWSFYISGGDSDKATTKLIEVKDGLVFENDRYYAPAPYRYGEKIEQADGWFFGSLLTRDSGWFGVEKRAEVNVFWTSYPVNVNPTIEQIKKLKPNSTEIYAYPYGHDFIVDYSQSGRSGLCINSISLRDFKNFFVQRYCSPYNYGGKGHPSIMISDDVLSKIEYGSGWMSEYDFGKFTSELDNILNTSSYDVDDSEEYGEYSLRNIRIQEKDCKRFFDCIQKRLNELS